MPSPPVDEVLRLLQEALAHHQSGRRDQAEALYRRVLATSPDHADALNLLGALLDETGRMSEAEGALRRAVAVAPGSGVAHFNLANILARGGHVDEALTEWSRAAELSIDVAFESHMSRAAALVQLQRHGEAVEAVRAAAAVVPVEQADALVALQKIAVTAGDFQTAAGAALEVSRRNPADTGQKNEAGRLLFRAGRLIEAADVFRETVTLTSARDPAALLNLAQVIGAGGAIELTEGVLAAQRAVELKPDWPDAHETLASLLRTAGRPGESAHAARRAIALRPPHGSARAQHALGNAMFDSGAADEAIAAYRKSLEMDATRQLTIGALLMTLDYASDHDPQRVFEEHKKWARAFSPPSGTPGGGWGEGSIRVGSSFDVDEKSASHLALPLTPSQSTVRGRLRVGYLSPDFRRHPVAYFFEPLLQSHNRSEFDVFLYYNGRVFDDFTARFRELVGDEHFRDVTGLDDDAAARLVCADGIDILVDLAGHTADNRLAVLARRPAAVQMTYIGYWNTTGLEGVVDYRITDAVNDPPGGPTERYWVEKLLRVDGGAWCYQPPDDRPDVSRSPALANGFVTFLAPHKPIKTTDAMLRLWRRVLEQAPTARMILVAGGNEERARKILLHGLADPSRVEILARMTPAEYFNLYSRADVVLDVFPHNGHTIGCEALWQGVPVLTTIGPTHASRLTASVLSSAGLAGEGLITSSAEEYVQRAVEIAHEAGRFAELRSSMRERLRASNLMNGRRLAREVERLFASIVSRSARP